MTIRLQGDTADVNLVLPTRLLFSRRFWKLGLWIGRKYSLCVPDLPPAVVDGLCREIRRTKRKYGSWELVRISNADGYTVQIDL
jgi:hypothetical protein